MPKNTTPAKKKVNKPEPVESTDVIAPAATNQTPKTKKNMIPLIIGLIVLSGIIIFARKNLTAAIVNGESISRLRVISELEKQSGKQAVDALVTETIILQEAKKNSVTVSEKEVDAQLKDIEKSLAGSGQSLDEALLSKGLTKETLKKQIRIQKMLEKMAGKGVTVTDKEVDAFLKQNEQVIPKDADKKEIRAQAKEQLMQDKMGAKIQKWIEDHKKKAKIVLYKQY